MPTVEFDTSNIAEITTGTSSPMYNRHPSLAISNLVSDTSEVEHTTNNYPKRMCISSSGPTTILDGEESPVEIDGMENQRVNKQRRVQLQPSLSADSTAISFDPIRLAREMDRYSPIQQRFIQWGQDLHRDVVSLANVIDLVNFLAYGHINKGWALSTCVQYKQALLMLYPSEVKLQMQQDSYLIQFFRGL